MLLIQVWPIPRWVKSGLDPEINSMRGGAATNIGDNKARRPPCSNLA